MSLEPCQLCKKDSTPWYHINGHICHDCYHRDKWIDAKERLPDKDGRYLIVEDHSYKWIGVCAMREGRFDMPITHWMPLPESPKD